MKDIEMVVQLQVEESGWYRLKIDVHRKVIYLEKGKNPFTIELYYLGKDLDIVERSEE